MHWEILIIPLIALGVWILGTLFKGEEERNKRGARGPGGSVRRGPTRRPVTDLDRFLEESRRRRETEERERTLPVPPPRPVVSRPPLRERVAKPRETPPRITLAMPPPEPPPVAVPVARPVQEPVAQASPPPPVPPARSQDLPLPILRQVRSLLSSPQSAGAALVLREILDRPRSMRRR